jgi:ubiquinone/menaquinone biosynthesis C-methylase UbiE
MRANCSVSTAAMADGKKAVENVQFVEGKAEKIPFEDKSVDIGIAVYLPIFD